MYKCCLLIDGKVQFQSLPFYKIMEPLRFEKAPFRSSSPSTKPTPPDILEKYFMAWPCFGSSGTEITSPATPDPSRARKHSSGQGNSPWMEKFPCTLTCEDKTCLNSIKTSPRTVCALPVASPPPGTVAEPPGFPWICLYHTIFSCLFQFFLLFWEASSWLSMAWDLSAALVKGEVM